MQRVTTKGEKTPTRILARWKVTMQTVFCIAVIFCGTAVYQPPWVKQKLFNKTPTTQHLFFYLKSHSNILNLNGNLSLNIRSARLIIIITKRIIVYRFIRASNHSINSLMHDCWSSYLAARVCPRTSSIHPSLGAVSFRFFFLVLRKRNNCTLQHNGCHSQIIWFGIAFFFSSPYR